MKFVWEPEDIKAGLKVGCANGAQETFMIGYDTAEYPNPHLVIFSLADGGVIRKGMSNQETATFLTAGGYRPLQL